MAMEEELLWDIFGEASDDHRVSFIPTTASSPKTHHHVSETTIDRDVEADMIKALVHQTPPFVSQQTAAGHAHTSSRTTWIPAPASTTLADRTGGGRSCSRPALDRFVSKIPWSGYVCRRCHEPGHYLQHCPTNGDPDYDIKEVKRPSGIPMSMLKANPEGSYKLPNGAVAVVEPDEATFDKEMEGLPTNRRALLEDDLPPELHCPLCKKVMRDAAITRKCCHNTFCDKCIRDHIINSQYSTCFCGVEDVLTDDLVPNLTIRELIARLLESSSPLTTTTRSSTSWPYGTHKRKSTDQEQYVTSSSSTDRDHPSKRQRCEPEIAYNYQPLRCIS